MSLKIFLSSFRIANRSFPRVAKRRSKFFPAIPARFVSSNGKPSSPDGDKVSAALHSEENGSKSKFSPRPGRSAGTTATRLDQNPDCGGRSKGEVSEHLTQVSPADRLEQPSRGQEELEKIVHKIENAKAKLVAERPKESIPAGVPPEDLEYIEIYRNEADRKTLVDRWITNAKVVENGTRVINKKKIKVPRMKIQDLVWSHVRQISHERVASSSLTGKEYTYFMVEQASKCLAAGLRFALFLERGSRVAIVLPNVPEYLIIYYGILSAGMVVVPVNPLLTSQELLNDLSVIKPHAIICAAPAHNNLEGVVKRLSEAGRDIPLIPMSRNCDLFEEDVEDHDIADQKYTTTVVDLILQGTQIKWPNDPQRHQHPPGGGSAHYQNDDDSDLAVLPFMSMYAIEKKDDQPSTDAHGEAGDFAESEDEDAPDGVQERKEGPVVVKLQTRSQGTRMTKICPCRKNLEPRIARLTHHNIVSNLAAMMENGLQVTIEHARLEGEAFDPTAPLRRIKGVAREKLLCLVPFSHYYGQLISQVIFARHGGEVVMMPLFAPDFFVRTMTEQKPTILVLIPPILEAIVNSPKVLQKHLASVKLIVTSIGQIDHELMRKFKRKFKRRDIIFKQNYTLLRAGVVCSTVNRFVGSFDPASLGAPIANVECRIFSTRTNTPIAWPTYEQPGRIEVRGPNVMEHYWNCEHPDDCRHFNGRFLKTEDLGFFNTAGEFFLAERFRENFVIDGAENYGRDLDEGGGRMSSTHVNWPLFNFFLRLGVKIPAKKLELQLQTHPKVEDAAILEVYTPPRGFAPRGFIVLKSKKSRDYLTLSEVNKYLESIMGVKDALRAGLQIVDELPRKSDGKIVRTELKRIYYNDLGAKNGAEEEEK